MVVISTTFITNLKSFSHNFGQITQSVNCPTDREPTEQHLPHFLEEED